MNFWRGGASLVSSGGGYDGGTVGRKEGFNTSLKLKIFLSLPRPCKKVSDRLLWWTFGELELVGRLL